MHEKKTKTVTTTSMNTYGDPAVTKHIQSIIGVPGTLYIEVHRDQAYDYSPVIIDWYDWNTYDNTKKKLASKEVNVEMLQDTVNLKLYNNEGLVIAEVLTHQYYDEQWRLVAKSEKQSGNCVLFNKYSVDNEWDNFSSIDFVNPYEKEHDCNCACDDCVSGGKCNKKTGAVCIEEAPKNNDGRTTCFWCGAPTKKVSTGFVKEFDICTECKQ